MERSSAMFLHCEDKRVLLLEWSGLAGRLGRNVEVPLFRVFLECHVFVLTQTGAAAFARTLQHEWSALPRLSGVCCSAPPRRQTKTTAARFDETEPASTTAASKAKSKAPS